MLLGCGDIGRRIATHLLDLAQPVRSISGTVNSQRSVQLCAKLGISVRTLDLDSSELNLSGCNDSDLYYTVAPQATGHHDLRSRNLLQHFNLANVKPRKIVLISTTGVYGDCQGEWVNETSAVKPQSARAQRRLDSETQWREWCTSNYVPLVILRVPGIYAKSRIPHERLQKATPVVFADQCGFSNRIHADDLAQIAVSAMRSDQHTQQQIVLYNVSDGQPSTITDYLQAAAKSIGLPPLQEISMQQAEQFLSPSMLSYLKESRRIDSRKVLSDLSIQLIYPDFKQGLKF